MDWIVSYFRSKINQFQWKRWKFKRKLSLLSSVYCLWLSNVSGNYDRVEIEWFKINLMKIKWIRSVYYSLFTVLHIIGLSAHWNPTINLWQCRIESTFFSFQIVLSNGDYHVDFVFFVSFRQCNLVLSLYVGNTWLCRELPLAWYWILGRAMSRRQWHLC